MDVVIVREKDLNMALYRVRQEVVEKRQNIDPCQANKAPISANLVQLSFG
jgi:hypothetical protein